jgi:hypothetical protein
MALRKHQDNAIAEALCSSRSVADAARKLGMATSNLESRCRAEGLIALYEKCAERGRTARGAARKRPRLPHWGIHWTPPGSTKSVRIWGTDAASAEEALVVAKNYQPNDVVPAFIKREELSAVEEISK